LVLHGLMIQGVPAFAHAVENFFQLVLVYIAVLGEHVVVVIHLHETFRPERGFAVAVQLYNLGMAQLLDVFHTRYTSSVVVTNIADIDGTVLSDTRGFVA
jgi:hypothetical protein